MSAGRVSVIVPAFNNWALTQRCCTTLRSATGADGIADLIVVDDGSTDGESAAWAATQTAWEAVLAPHNGGFSRACNAGAARAGGDVLVFLNNDAFVRPGSIAALLATLDADPAIGIVGAKLLYADGSLQHAGLTLLAGPVSRWWHVHRHLPGNLPDANVARDVLAVTGAALMIRRSLFEQLDGFDAGYTNGWEDVDLCLRSWASGARVRYEPRAVIEHLESATLGRTHDDGANERRFVGRWGAVLASAPRYPLAEIPPLAFAVRRAGVADDAQLAARDALSQSWSRHFGARVSRFTSGSHTGRIAIEIQAALAKRRPTLEVAWADAALDAPTGGRRAVFVAPLSVAEAQPFAALTDVSWWTPTAASRDALVAAGAAFDRITVISLGAEPMTLAERTGALVVGAAAADADLLATLAGRVPHVNTRVLPAGALAEFAAIDIFVARVGGDRWGRLVPAALAHGCRVIATPPVDAVIAGTTGVSVAPDDAALLLEAQAACAVDCAELRAHAPAIALAARRRLDAALAAQHAAQTARALVHGVPSAALVAVGAELAARLRAAADAVSQ